MNIKILCFKKIKKHIQNWLKYTTFFITLVENSNDNFPELEQYSYRFEYITYDEKQYKVYNSLSKGIIYTVCVSTFRKIEKRKITARYFIPELESYLKSINILEYECLVQHDIDRCEMYDFFNTIFNYRRLL